MLAYATLTDDPWLNLAAAVISASAKDGEVDALVPVLDAYMYEVTDVPRVATTLALKCYRETLNSKTGYHCNTIEQHRLAAQLTFKELARLVGITTGALATIEKYGAVPSETVQARLALALQCTVAELWPEI